MTGRRLSAAGLALGDDPQVPRYVGAVLDGDGAPKWLCPHAHRTREAARRCAEKWLRACRRKP